jgi:hypothetical protein
MTFDFFLEHDVTACPDSDDFCVHCACGALIHSFTKGGRAVCKQHSEVPIAQTRHDQPRPAEDTT